MNTISLVLNGRTAADISHLPERQRASLTTLYAPRPYSPSLSPSTPPRSPTLSGSKGSSPSTPTRSRRPQYKRAQPSRDSPGWYNTEGGMTLDDFAKRLNTLLGRFEQWQGKCAQNVVMALMRPTPVMLFVLNPISLVIWLGIVVWWVYGRVGGVE